MVLETSVFQALLSEVLGEISDTVVRKPHMERQWHTLGSVLRIVRLKDLPIVSGF